MYEKTIQELAERLPDVVFPGLGLRITGRQVPVPGGAADLMGVDPGGTEWVIELKRDTLRPGDVDQVLRYLHYLRQQRPRARLCAMLAGPDCGSSASARARELGVLIHIFDDAALQDAAAGLQINDLGARPRRNGSPTRPSRPRGSGATRQVNHERAAHQRELDRRFPPGSLVYGTPRPIVLDYWRTAAPAASAAMHELVTDLSIGVLASVPTAAVSNRASAWTVLRRADGMVIAALEPKRTSTHMSCLLPDDLAETLRAQGRLAVHQVRNGGKWATFRGIGVDVSPDEVLAWYRTGLELLNP